jgi:ComF family protein
MLSKIKKEILDIVFPVFCVGCKKEGEWLCKDCLGLISPAEKQFCPLCGRISEFGKTCEHCSGKSALSAVISCGFYHNPVLRACVGALKYDNAREIVPQIEKIIIRFLEKYGFFGNFRGTGPRFSGDCSQKVLINSPILVPVPLHRRRLWARGFNQAEIIARILSRNFNLQINNKILKRKIATGEQAKMKPDERKENTKNAFVLLNKERIAGKSIVLIDDVYTTGSTMQECAKIIRESGGVDKIYGFVLARG